MYNRVNQNLGGTVLEGFKKFVKTTLYPACLIFTAIVFFFSLMYELVDVNRSSAYNLISLIQFFVFSLILCWSKELFNDDKMSFAAAHFIHFVVFLLNVIISFIFIGQMTNFFGILAAFSLLYLVGAIVALIIRRATKKKKVTKKANYKKQFR